MASYRFLSIPWVPNNISDTDNMIFKNFIHFENLTFLKLQTRFLSFDVFHSKNLNFCEFSNPIGFFSVNAKTKPSQGKVKGDINKNSVDTIFI